MAPQTAQTESRESIPSPQPIPPTLAEAEAGLRALEDEHAELTAKIHGLRDAPAASRMSDAAKERVSPAMLANAAPYLSLPERRRIPLLAESEEIEVEVRGRLVEARGRVARLRQSSRSREAAKFRGEHQAIAVEIATHLNALETLLTREADIRHHVVDLGVVVSPLPDASLRALGSRRDTNSPAHNWFRRMITGGYLEKK